jgi:peptide/nickel transport system substrate-binding protein
MTRRLSRFGTALAGATLLTTVAALSATAQTIKYVPDADLRVLDPIFTTAGTTLNHGVLIYDFLVAPDAKNEPQPQMVESWRASADGLTYTFKLRPGLKWHDGTAVQAKDAVASLKRWGAKVPSGRDTFTRVADVVATGTDTFEVKLKRPFGRLVSFLAEPINPPFIMREVDAKTDQNTAITSAVGSGPFRFDREEWIPGSRVVYSKNKDYVPRTEKAEHMAGGKVVKIDKVEWVILPDPMVAANAVAAGEVDYLENPLIDMLPTLRRNPNLVVQVVNPYGYQMIMRPNHLVPPFNNPKVRQVLLYAVDQQAYLEAAVGDPALRKPCWAILICGGPYESQAGLGDWTRPGAIEKAKQLLKESGYKGEKVVIMHPTDQTVIGAMTMVTANRLKEVGFNVDLQSMDWSSLISRRPIKESPETNRGGWNIFHTWGFAGSLMEPLTSSFIASPCDGNNWFGWPCDEELDKIRYEFETVANPQQGKQVADRYQTRFYQSVPLVPLGQFTQPVVHRKNITGVLTGTRIVMWNLEKK